MRSGLSPPQETSCRGQEFQATRAGDRPIPAPSSTTRPRPSTEAALNDVVREGADIFHFGGHALFDPIANEGKLLLESADRKTEPYRGGQLAQVLRGAGVRLALLGAWPPSATHCQLTRWQSRWHWLSLIEQTNVAWPEIELSRLLLGQVLVRQFGSRIGRNALPDLCDHLLDRNRRHPALSPPDARERNHNNRSAAYFGFSHHISMA
jgi:hypothetical protein